MKTVRTKLNSTLLRIFELCIFSHRQYSVLLLGVLIYTPCNAQNKDSILNAINYLETEIPKMENLVSRCNVYIGEYQRSINIEELPYHVLYKDIVREIDIPSRYAKIANSEMFPDSSYSITRTGSGHKLIITEPDKFWEFTNNLIIRTNSIRPVDSTESARPIKIDNLLDINLYKVYPIPSSKARSKIQALRKQIKSNEKYLEALSEWEFRLDKTLHEAYIIIGRKDDLKKLGIIRSGIFNRSPIIYKKINKSQFFPKDNRGIERITISSRKAKILSKVNPNSYRIEHKNFNTIIYITEPSKFWKNSKYLIIQE